MKLPELIEMWGPQDDVDKPFADVKDYFAAYGIRILHAGVFRLSNAQQFLGWVQVFHQDPERVALSSSLGRQPRLPP